ncbi:MAG: metal-dependent transcriptional regulator [Candidatus Methanomethylicia archaeon]
MELSIREATYIKVIGKLTENGTKATSSIEIAKVLGVKAPSAIDMIKRLSSMGIVEYTPWRGVKFTDYGLKEYRKLLRKNKILETYLHEVFGMKLDEICEYISKFDLYVPQRIINVMCTCLGHPRKCPHGDEIPIDEDCCVRK